MKKTKDSTLKWVAKRTKKFWPAIILVTLLNVFVSLILIGLASASKNVIDYGAQGNRDKLVLSTVFMFALIIGEIISNAAISMLNVRIKGKLTISLRNYMFSSIVHKKYPKVFDHHSGDLLNRFTSDIDTLVAGAVGIIPSVSSMAAKIIAGIWALLIENYLFAIAVLVIGFIFPAIGRKISKKYKFLHKEVSRTEGQARSFLQESFANIVVIKTFVSEKPILSKLNTHMNENLRLKLKLNWISVFIHMLLFSFFTFGYYGIMVWGSTMLVSGLTFGTLNYFLQLVSILRTPLQNISGVIPQYYSMIASAERLIDLEKIEDEPQQIENSHLQTLKENFKTINVDNLAFAYKDELILKNCTFKINSNSITALTGESGSGKSTIFKMLLGLYEPSGGSITFNGQTPIDASTRDMFSYVPQGNMILSGTIRDNITLCNNAITDEQIEKATRAAVIYDFIQTLPDGLDTVLSERGAGLSEGQVQRISIARALLFDAPVLLLDESTSALDETTETELLSNIKSMTDKTVIFITHRNTSISVCDHIVHVENKKFEAIK
ncbi:MAG: ABC transporter ATP-binding protein [Clostridia bacterium]|nr:ABC transporter ATP-binding protein [Clostridia bacterium]